MVHKAPRHSTRFLLASGRLGRARIFCMRPLGSIRSWLDSARVCLRPTATMPMSWRRVRTLHGALDAPVGSFGK
eukprot:13910090-Alexandrium_andersonii.AAC.1